MGATTVNPLNDARWNDLLLRCPQATVFHTSGWLDALQRTYGYEPVLYTTSCLESPLKNGLALCEVNSWLTGRRLVSLPFSDHCDLLADDDGDGDGETELLAQLAEHVRRNGMRYVEVRPLRSWGDMTSMGWQPAEQFCFHLLSLDPGLDDLFRNLHKDCIQRKIRRAEREGLTYENGRSESLLQKFYALLLRTRRRHCLPPQPLLWFRNLAKSMGDGLAIRVASKDNRPVAAILTLSFKDTLTYKYGCSDERFSELGGTPFLFWKTIQEAKGEGMRRLDLGRSDMDNEGLAKFKDRLGAVRTTVTYWCYSNSQLDEVHRAGRMTSMAKHLFPKLPDAVLAASGRFLYRHMG